jgi:D-arginine dehydrogenase
MDFMVPVWNVCIMVQQFDFIVIGAGIAGASVAAHLAEHASVGLLDMEERAGYHSTGRSAASYEPNYGPPSILALTRASAAFFMSPPVGFCDAPIFSKRGSLVLEPAGQQDAAHQFLSAAVGLREVGGEEMLRILPILNPHYAKRGFFDDSTGDLDVDLLHGGYLRLLKARGGKVFLNALAKNFVRKADQWHVITPFDRFTATTIVNAAGAWGDEVAKLADVSAIGLTPKRRSIGVIPVDDHPDVMAWPFMVDCAETWYAKPQSGKLLVSSADVTPVAPHDAYADDMAIAEGVERLMEATTLDVTRLEHSWGGLRTFSKDGAPVVGFDPHADGFFWLVGQGGYGIQSSPAVSRLAATMAMRGAVPDDIMAAGLNMAEILPDRFYR